MKVKLGKHKFGEARIGFDSERLWIGAHRRGYLRRYYFGNPAGYQYYWLSYNMAGAGRLSEHMFTPGQVGRGVPCPDVNSPDARAAAEPIDSSGITVNTLTVLSPEATQEVLAQFTSRDVLGADEATVRLASTIRPPSDLTLRSRLRARRLRAQLAIKQAWQWVWHR